MMNQPNEIEQLEVSIEQAKEAIKLRDTLIKLSKNRDFGKIIHTGYFEDEAVRLVMAKSNPHLQSKEQQDEIIKKIDAIGALRQYFSQIMSMGNQMEHTLAMDEQTREAILAEDLEK